MKQLKNIRQYLAFCLIVLSVTSCSDWFDGALPKDKNLEEDQFSTESGVNSVLNGIYRRMAGNSLYGAKLTTTSIELLAHYYYYGTNIASVDAGYTAFYYTSEYDQDKLQDYFTGVWGDAYGTIYQINNFIHNLEQYNPLISEEKKSVLFGEAYALRAFLHFDLFRIFGDKDHGIPYNDSYEVLPHSFKTTEEVFDLILKDIAKATNYLKNDPIRTLGVMSFYKQNGTFLDNILVADRFAYFLRNYRMNYYAVQALKARVLMNKGDVREAAQLAQEVLDTTSDIFKWADYTKIVSSGTEKNPDYIFYSEVMFGIYDPSLHTRWEEYTAGNVLGSVYALHINNIQDNIFKYDATNSDISNWADVRSRQWVPSKIGGGQYVSRKFDDGYDNASNNPKQFFRPLIRTSELRYIIAEWHISEGRIADGIGVINTLLSKRGVTNEALRDPTVSESEAFNILETEYYKEFYGEGQAYFYLKRRNNPQVFKVDVGGKKAIGSGAYRILVPTNESIND